MKLTKENAQRLVNFGRKVWKMLTDAEREAYYLDNGTIGFVEDIATVLHLQLCEVSLAEFEAIHNLIVRGIK
jgi:hypothetical protein